jgi:hypothetical protein
MATLIQIRRDTLDNWTSVNPVLQSGEISFVTDQNKFKVGDGSSLWADLPYLKADAFIDSVELGTDTTGNYAAQVTGSGEGILVTGSGESASVVIENTGVVSLSGTENEIEVSASTGSVTIGLPSTISSDTTGNSATATALETSRTISFGGDLSGSATFDGTQDITINATLDSDSSVNSLTGTDNQIDVSASVGAVTLSLPETINVDTSGNAATATALETSRVIELNGDISGSASFDGSASISISATIEPNSVSLGTDTTGNYVASASAGAGIVISGSGSENANITIENDGVLSLTGTASQISVSASNGDPTLSFPSSVVFPGSVTLNSNPTESLGAATKQYVDEVAQGLVTKPSVLGATVSNVSGIYDNGSSGVGATLTHDTDGVFPPTAGGATGWQIGSGILLKNQTNKEENGRYYISDMGSLSTPYVLTRCGFCDEADEIPGAYIFVQSGTYEGTGWIQVVDDPTTFVVGTDDINVYQFSGAGTYTAGSGLNLDGTQFSNAGVLSLTGTANEIEVSASAGNIVVGLPSTISSSTTGNSATADKLSTARTIALTGDVTGNVSFDGSASVSISTSIAENSVTLGTDTSGNYVATATAGTGIEVTGSGSENAGITVTNTGVTSLVGTANEVEVSSSAGAITISLPATINADTTGNSGTSTKLTTARAIALTGDVTGTANFDGSASAGISTTLANSGVSASSYGSSSEIPILTIDEKGRVTSASVAIIESLPDQTGNAGEFLTTDGTNASWSALNVEPTIHPMFIIGGV